ncbi:MAG: thioredoxin [Burkholderiaceae bacterium]
MSTDTTIQSFQTDVIDASADALVLVDFWAEWCGPCKSLGPILEKLEADYGGRVKLVKVDTEAEQQLAQHFQIRSLPTVFAFLNGQPVDQFQGALPEGQIREFIDRHLPNPAEAEFELAAKALNEGDQATALEHAKRTVSLDPNHDTARLLIAQLQLAAGDPGAAQSQMDALSAASLANPQVAELAEQIAQAFEATQVPPPTELLQKVEAAPTDPQARADLAEHYITHKMWDEALEQLLEIVKHDREFREDFGRTKMIEVFKLAAEQPTVVSAWRRKLGSTLNVV